jgi:hypothetical protein
MPFQKGNKLHGSRKGKPNKALASTREVVEMVMPREERFGLLAKMAKEGNYKALELLCYYSDGKPRESVDMNLSGGVKIIKENI